LIKGKPGRAGFSTAAESYASTGLEGSARQRLTEIVVHCALRPRRLNHRAVGNQLGNVVVAVIEILEYLS